jgi:hypothetical protein
LMKSRREIFIDIQINLIKWIHIINY